MRKATCAADGNLAITVGGSWSHIAFSSEASSSIQYTMSTTCTVDSAESGRKGSTNRTIYNGHSTALSVAESHIFHCAMYRPYCDDGMVHRAVERRLTKWW